ncbi:MAG TPA: hypothetical protein PK239_12155 [Chitinophagales bacterium]|nr:hypothetical protein [Chitinophagales bacterium]
MESNNRQAIFIGVIALLFLLNMFLLYQNQRLRSQHKDTVQVMETEKNTLQADFDRTIAELEQYKLDSEQKTTEITDLEGKIDEQKQEIAKILSKSNASASELKKARQLIEGLRTSADDYKKQIEALTFQNQQLQQENTGLKGTISEKEQTLQQKEASLAQAEAEKAELASAKQTLSEQKDQLSSTVKRGSVMQAANITGMAVDVRKSGKEVATSRARKADQLKVCFDVLRNPIAKPGRKEIMLRIISPQGDVLSVESMGSGVFTEGETGEQMKYTTKAAIDYQNQSENYCMYWEQNSSFIKGNYTAEVYNDGYLIGSGGFTIK